MPQKFLDNIWLFSNIRHSQQVSTVGEELKFNTRLTKDEVSAEMLVFDQGQLSLLSDFSVNRSRSIDLRASS